MDRTESAKALAVGIMELARSLAGLARSSGSQEASSGVARRAVRERAQRPPTPTFWKPKISEAALAR